MKLAGVTRSVVAAVAVVAIALAVIDLANRHNRVVDVSRAARNSITPASVRVVQLLEAPLTVTAFVPDNPRLRRGLADFFARYGRHKPDLTLAFVDPREDLAAARELGANLGEIVISYQGRHERLTRLNESEVSNALARLARGAERFVTFLSANGERRVAREANHDLSAFAAHLESRGLAVREYATGSLAAIPDNAAVLVIASPAVAYAPGELDQINRFVAGGGNLLWLLEPDRPRGLDALASALGVSALPGTVVDPVGLTRLRNPAYAVAYEHADHALLEGFGQTVAFPYAAALLATPNAGWQATPIARTGDDAWTETGPFEGNVGYDADDEVQGSLVLGLALTRTRPGGGEQRVIVLGDGDFLSNSFVDNLGNRAFGRRVFEWLAADDALIDVAVEPVPDAVLELAMWQRMAIFLVFAVLVPLGFAVNGALYGWRRRHA